MEMPSTLPPSFYSSLVINLIPDWTPLLDIFTISLLSYLLIINTPQFVHLVTSDWLEVLLLMKDVLNFATTMPGAPSVTMDLILMMPMSSVVNLAILIMVHVVLFDKH